MVARNTGSIAEEALKLIDSVPANVSGAMASMADLARIDLQNTLDVTIGTSIDEKYQGILINLTAAYALGRMLSIGTDFNFSLGEFRVDKGSEGRAETQQIKFFLDRANASIKGLGRTLRYFKALG